MAAHRVRHRVPMPRGFALLLVLTLLVLAAALFHDHDRLVQLEGRLSQLELGAVRRRISTVQISGAPVKGSRSAPAALVVYSDFQCPYCRGFAQTTLNRIERQYVTSGKLLVAFKHFPLERLHNSAIRAAEAASCANKQGRFWAMHDRIFAGPNIPAQADLIEWAAPLGVGRNEFSDCVDKHSALLQIRRDAEEAKSLGFTGTPAFALGPLVGSTVTVTHRIRGSRPPDDFASVIDQVLRGTNQVSLRLE